MAFALQSGRITPSIADRLRSHAGAGDAVLRRARQLRTALRGIFSAVATHAEADNADLAILNGEVAIAMCFARIEREPQTARYVWGWSDDEGRLDRALWPIARSAADLLTSAELLPLVRQCGADDCRWLFLDTSKNRSRQWCSMTACGNREKARRHYERVRARRAAKSG